MSTIHMTLGDDDVHRIALAVAGLVSERMVEHRSPDRWLTSSQAAEHLGVTVHALRHLVASGEIPHAQDGPGSKQFFRAAELDAWRAAKVRERRV